MTTTVSPEPPPVPTDPEAPAFYVTGGTLGAGAASYVERRADRDLLGGLTAGEFCYVLNSRQMGKSSLCVRTMARLKGQGNRTCFLDLTKFGGRNLSAEQWYAALLSEAGRELGLRSEMLTFWKANTELGPMQRFFGALQQVALPASESPLTVFVDEIDVTRGLPFSADEFFAGVRQCYVGRATDPALNRLTVCLLGTATPADLIQDTRTSPFNIGRRIEVRDFTPEEAQPLAQGLGTNGAVLLNRVLYWTGGHPYLTQRLCRAAQESGAKTPAEIDKLCSDLFLTRSAAETDDNLAFVRNRLLKSEVDLAGLLDLYGQMRRGRRVPDDEADPLCAVLKLSGVARTEGGGLKVRNRIYEHVFSREWIVEHTPGAELRRQREAYRSGLLRAATVSGVVVLLMGLLAGEAFHQSGVARAAVRSAQREAQRADRSEVEARMEEAAARQEAQEASAANGRAQAQKQIALHQTGLARQQAAIAQQKTQYAREQSGNAARQSATARRQTLLAQSNEQEAVRQRGRASTAAQQATTQAKIARDRAQDATYQKNLAEHTQQVADLQLAAQTWESADGPAGSVQDLLSQSQRSGRSAGAKPGTERFEWRLLWEKLHRGNAVTTHTAQGRYASIAVTAGGDFLSIDGQKQICDTPASDGSDSEGAATTVRPLPDAATLSSVSLSPDGTQVAVGRADGRLDLYAEDTLRRTASWQISQTPVSSVAFEPDGRTVQAWDGQALVEKSLSTDGTGERKPRQDVFQGVPDPALRSVSPAMHYIALMNTPTDGKITLRNLSRKDGTGFLTHVLAGHLSSIRCLQFSPDASQMASGDESGVVKLWDTATGARLNSWAMLSVPVQTLGFSADAKRLAAGAENGLIRVWNIGRVGTGSSETQTAAVTLKGQTRGISDLVFSADGHWLASADVGGDGRVWPLNGAGRGPGLGVETIAFAPDSQTFACTYWSNRAGLGLYDRRGLPSAARRPPSELRDGSAYIQSVAFSPDHRTAAAAGTVGAGTSGAGRLGMMRYFLQFWSWRTGRAGARWESPPLAADLGMEPMHGGLRRLAFSPDGRTVAGGFGESYLNYGRSYDQVVKLWDAASGRELRTLTGFRNNVNAVCFSPDGRMLVVGCSDRTVRCFDTRTWSESHCLSLSRGGTSVAYSPDGHTLAIGSADGFIYLTDTTRWRTRTLAAHSAQVADLAFSPDGQTLASASWDQTLKLWDVATGRQTQTVRADDWVHRVAFSPDGTLLAYGESSGPVRVLRAASAGQVAAWQRQKGTETGQNSAIRWQDTAALSRPALSDAHRWTDPAQERRQAQALLGEIERHQVPDRSLANPAANLIQSQNGQSPCLARLDPSLKDAAEAQTGGDGITAVSIRRVDAVDSHVQLVVSRLPLKNSDRYILQFRARADAPQNILVSSQQDSESSGSNGLDEYLQLSPQWQAFRLPFQVGLDVPPDHGAIVFDIGQQVNTLQFADMILVPEKNTTHLPGEVARGPVLIRASAGVLQLAAADAVTHGIMRYEPGADLDDLGWWGNPDDWAEWSVLIVKPGRFRVTALVAAMATGTFTVAAGNQSVQGTLPNTGSYFQYQSIELGTLAITQAGRVSISVHPVANGWPAMNLKALTLTPVP